MFEGGLSGRQRTLAGFEQLPRCVRWNLRTPQPAVVGEQAVEGGLVLDGLDGAVDDDDAMEDPSQQILLLALGWRQVVEAPERPGHL